MPKNFKSALTIKDWNLGATPPARKFGWIANISRSSVTGSWRQNSLSPSKVLYPVGKKAYKLDFSKKWRIHNVFHVLLLKQNNTRKRRVDDNNNAAELDTGDESREYKVEAIQDSAVYARESELGHLLALYYRVSWKRDLEEKNTWVPASMIQHFRKLINLFHKDYSDKPIATFPAINTASLIAKPTVKHVKRLKQ